MLRVLSSRKLMQIQSKTPQLQVILWVHRKRKRHLLLCSLLSVSFKLCTWISQHSFQFMPRKTTSGWMKVKLASFWPCSRLHISSWLLLLDRIFKELEEKIWFSLATLFVSAQLLDLVSVQTLSLNRSLLEMVSQQIRMIQVANYSLAYQF